MLVKIFCSISSCYRDPVSHSASQNMHHSRLVLTLIEFSVVSSMRASFRELKHVMYTSHAHLKHAIAISYTMQEELMQKHMLARLVTLACMMVMEMHVRFLSER